MVKLGGQDREIRQLSIKPEPQEIPLPRKEAPLFPKFLLSVFP